MRRGCAALMGVQDARGAAQGTACRLGTARRGDFDARSANVIRLKVCLKRVDETDLKLLLFRSHVSVRLHMNGTCGLSLVGLLKS